MEKAKYARFRWEKRENQRYYEALVDRDLFGWELTRLWGRMGTALGQVVRRPIDNFEAGINQIRLIDKQRQRRGYKNVLSRGNID